MDPKLLAAFTELQNNDAEGEVLKQQAQRAELLRGQRSPQYTRMPAAVFGGLADLLKERKVNDMTKGIEAKQGGLNANLLRIIQQYFGGTSPQQQGFDAMAQAQFMNPDGSGD
jgi:hypothetical protein